MTPLALNVLLTGVGATVIMDLWAVGARRLWQLPAPDYCLVGRWLSHMALGRFRHASIARAARRPRECALGWALHYGVGIAYAGLLVLGFTADWFVQPSLLPALMIGLGTLVMPWCVMQPAFGLGIAASKSLDPPRARQRSAASHLAFGLGLYVSASALQLIAPLAV